MPADECETFPDGGDPSVGHEVRGAILRHYREVGGPQRLGLPTSDERAFTEPHLTHYGDRGMDFQRGSIIIDRRTGEPIIFQFRTFGPARRLPVDPDDTGAERRSDGRAWSFGEPVGELVGLTEPEASARAAALGLRFRDLTDDIGHTDDARTGRVNVWCADGVVTRALIF